MIGHQKQWDFLKNKFESGKLGHAYLFSGESQLGKRTFAKEFVKLINCQEKKEKPCQKCQNCKMIEGERFPDLFTIKNNGQEITIDKAREAQNFLSYKSYYGSFKSVIIDEAEKMNQEAQSCFLKTVEEPKGKTIIIFVSLRPEALLPTIFSRCQPIKFFLARKGLIEDYLKNQGVGKDKAETLALASEGKPGRAMELFFNQGIIEKEKKLLNQLSEIINSSLAEKFQYVKKLELENNELNEILAVLIKYFREILFLKTGAGLGQKIQAPIPLTDYSLQKIKKNIELIDYIQRQASVYNINPKLALEYILAEI